MELYTLLYSIFVALAVLWSILHYRFIKLLQSDHRESWATLGRPNLLFNSAKKGLAIWRFLWSREYKRLGDQRLNDLALRLKIVTCAEGMLILAVIVTSYLNP